MLQICALNTCDEPGIQQVLQKCSIMQPIHTRTHWHAVNMHARMHARIHSRSNDMIWTCADCRGHQQTVVNIFLVLKIDAGSAGPPGGVGPPGAMGPRGGQGPQGMNGMQGSQGIPGMNGMNGAIGGPGPSGKDGIPGRLCWAVGGLMLWGCHRVL